MKLTDQKLNSIEEILIELQKRALDKTNNQFRDRIQALHIIKEIVEEK